MVYGLTGESITDIHISIKDKKLIVDDNSEIFDFKFENNNLYVVANSEKYADQLKHFFMKGKKVFVNSNCIEGTSLYYGDMLCDNFDEENNMINPPSDTGFFLYNLFGFIFDSSRDNLTNILKNIDPITCELVFLDKIAEEFPLKRRSEWSDEYWRALVIYYYYNFETIKGIEYVINRIYDYYNKNENDDIVEVEVDGYYSSFYVSDKFDSFSKCSDKFEELEDKLSSIKEYLFNITPDIVSENSLIKELLNILENGAVR
jgi:hypothetical protein